MMTLTDINEKIHKACKEAGRDPSTVALTIVSKNRSLDDINTFIEQGHRQFGENRVQEAVEKFTPLRARIPDLRLHLIGGLQSNKAAEAVALFDRIESLDRPSLADALKKEMDKQGRNIPCFIQVNTGEEPQKGGIPPKDLAGFVAYCRDDLKLWVDGLMCIPPADQLPEPHFALLHKLAGRENLPLLSMGMSADFDAAIRYGASHIRVGSALFS